MLVTAAPAVATLPTEAPMMMMGPITANTMPTNDKQPDIWSYFFLPGASPLRPASEACRISW